MGANAIKTSVDVKARKAFTYHLLKDIDTLDYMLQRNLFPKDTIRIGAEQELAIADEKMNPACKSLEVLDILQNKLFTTELSKFNIELNMDPHVLQAGVFDAIHDDLSTQMSELKKKTKALNINFPLAGILPTIEKADFDVKNMTPYQRYKVLNETLLKTKRSDFEIRISGVDELSMKLDSILAESCNTSFQIHLQLKPGQYKDMYNWAQMISAPVLAACTNSPIFLGRELWSETRIALFQQTVDSRNSVYLLREQRPRVTFGHDWVHECVSEIFKNDISHYPLLITAEIEEESSEALSNGKPPKLKALAMHNGNIYKWNRLCYGVSDGKPHLRIENRYIPTGPTLIDEVANIAFWVGIMKAMPDEYKDLPEKMDFKASRQNFYKAAKHGLNTQFDWMGKRISAKALLLTEMLPLAKKGLQSVGIEDEEIAKYLTIVEQRIKKNKTGAHWMSTNFNRLKKKFTKRRTAFYLTQQMLSYQEKDIPVHEWKNIKISKETSQPSDFTVSDVMTTDLIVVNENDPILILQHLMKWNNIHEILVENNDHKLSGIVSIDQNVELFTKTNKSRSVKTIMNKDVKTISPDVELEKAKEMMKKYKLSAIPVIFDDKLIGIVTNEHFKQFSVDV